MCVSLKKQEHLTGAEVGFDGLITGDRMATENLISKHSVLLSHCEHSTAVFVLNLLSCICTGLRLISPGLIDSFKGQPWKP